MGGLLQPPTRLVFISSCVEFYARWIPRQGPPGPAGARASVLPGL